MNPITRYTIVPSIVALGALLLLCSCTTPPPPKIESTPAQTQKVEGLSTATNEAIQKSDAAREKEFQTLRGTAGVVKAKIGGARDLNEYNPAGAPRLGVDGELKAADTALSNIEPDPLEVAEVAKRKALVLSGDLEKVRKAYDTADQEAKKYAETARKAREEADQLQTERDAARHSELEATKKYMADAEAGRLANEKAIQDLNTKHKSEVDRIHSAVLHKQVLYLNIAGGACLLIFGVAVGFGQLAGARIAWPFGVFAPLCFGLAQLVSQTWFMWACGGVAIVGFALAGWWIWSRYKLGLLKDDLQTKSTQFKGVLSDLVPVLDQAYDDADETTKALLDKTIFSKLSERMDKSVKSVVHLIRADLPEPKEPTPPTS